MGAPLPGTIMSKHAKLYERLKALECDFARRVLAEMNKESRGRRSEILARFGVPVRKARGEGREMNEFFRMEHEIIEIRHKLGEPLDEGIREILHDIRAWDYPSEGRRVSCVRANLPRVRAFLAENDNRASD